MTLTLPATAHGWQRRPEHDLPCVWAWETPDGVIVYRASGVVPRLPAPVVARDWRWTEGGRRDAEGEAS